MKKAKFKIGDKVIVENGFGSWELNYKPKYNKKTQEWEYPVSYPQYHFMSRPTYKRMMLKESKIERFNPKKVYNLNLSGEELMTILHSLKHNVTGICVDTKFTDVFYKLKKPLHRTTKCFKELRVE